MSLRNISSKAWTSTCRGSGPRVGRHSGHWIPEVFPVPGSPWYQQFTWGCVVFLMTLLGPRSHSPVRAATLEWTSRQEYRP